MTVQNAKHATSVGLGERHEESPLEWVDATANKRNRMKHRKPSRSTLKKNASTVIYSKKLRRRKHSRSKFTSTYCIFFITLIITLIFVHNINIHTTTSEWKNGGGGDHPQVEVADLVGKTISLRNVMESQADGNQDADSNDSAQKTKKRFTGKAPGNEIHSNHGRKSDDSAEDESDEEGATNDQDSGANDNERISKASDHNLLQTLKPISDITWHDLNFKSVSEHAPSCSSVIAASDISFTLVTQLSEDRLWMLTHQCERWPGPISVAVFTDSTISELEARLVDEAAGNYDSCYPNKIHFQTVKKDNVPEGEYPVNALRNLALKGVFTSHLFYVDIDFWVSKNLYNVLHSTFTREQISEDSKLALVVPAFQIGRQCSQHEDCREKNILKMPNSKSELVYLLKKRKASAFDPTNRGGHGSTSYSDWFHMNKGDLRDIPCITSNRYEPYYAVRYCRDLPPFQEAFTGYGKNKITQIMHMRYAGYLFSQLGGVYAVHFPHARAKTRATWDKARKFRKKVLAEQEVSGVEQNIDWTKFKRGQVDKLFVEFRKWLKDGIEDRSRMEMCDDAQDDDEKLWVKN